MYGMPGTSVGSEVVDAFRIRIGGEARASRCCCSSCSERRARSVALFPDLHLCLNDYSGGDRKFDNPRSQSAFFEFLLKVRHCLVVPALG